MNVQTPSAAPPMPASRHEPCEECGAPMDPQQRYCINCAARRGNGANPASRYFAAMSKRARRPPAQARRPGGTTARAAAVAFFALLPVAVAVGVLVGRTGSGEDNSALVDALRRRGSSAAVGGPLAGPSGKGAVQKKAAATKQGKAQGPGLGKPVAKTQYGAVHKVTGFKPSKQEEEEGKELVENNVKQTGANYIQAQTNLPDVTVVGGNPNEAPSLPTGKAQP